MDERPFAYARLVFYGSTSLWNLCQGAFQVLLPLYALSLGFSTLKIASLVALPIVAQLVTRFVGGVVSDRAGERRVLQGCYVLMALSVVVLAGAGSFLGLFLAQTISNFSRGIFWVTAQSLASQLPGSHSGKKLGWMAACNNTGSVLGYNLGGILPALFGYAPSFFILLAGTLVCIAAGFVLPKTEPKPSGRTVGQISRGVVRVLFHPPMWFTISASYSSALPASLAQSIYPVYLAALGYGAQWIGAAVSLRALGVVLAALAVARLVKVSREKAIYALGLTALGLSLIASGLSGQLLLISAAIAALGTAGGVMDLLWQVQATERSREADRSVAFAAGGLGWSLSHITNPLLAAWLAEDYGFPFALAAMGGLMLAMAAGTRLWYRVLVTKAAAPQSG